MFLTIYNFLMSLLWSSLFVVAFCFLRRRPSFIRSYGLMPLICLLLLGFFRFFVTFEIPFTKIIPSYRFLPAIQRALRLPSGLFHLSYGRLLVLIWPAVSLLLLIRLCCGLISQNRAVNRLKRNGTAPAAAMADELGRALNISDNCTAVTMPGLASPAVYGFFSPTVLMPDMEIPEKELWYILRHELFHFANRDAWLKLFIAVFKVAFWWNPLVYLLDKSLEYVLELRCDACATAGFSPGQKIAYVETVLNLIKRTQRRTGEPKLSFSLGGQLSRKELTSRMELIFSPNMRKKRLSPVLVAATLLLTLLSYSFVVQPAGYPPEEDLVGTFEPNFESAYILHTVEGSYELYIDGELFQYLNKALLRASPINEIRIIEETTP